MDKEAQNAAERFANELMETSIFKTYYRKKEDFNTNDDCQEVLLKFDSLRADLMEKQQSGNLTQEDMQELRQMQKELHSMETYQELKAAEGQAAGFVQEINKELSGPLGFDFGTFVKPPGGCC